MERILKDDTRLFFVVDAPDLNEEIFITYGEAREYKQLIPDRLKPRLYIASVNNAYPDKGGRWNYEDFSDTFMIVNILEGED